MSWVTKLYCGLHALPRVDHPLGTRMERGEAGGLRPFRLCRRLFPLSPGQRRRRRGASDIAWWRDGQRGIWHFTAWVDDGMAWTWHWGHGWEWYLREYSRAK